MAVASRNVPPEIFGLALFQGLTAKQKTLVEKEAYLDVAPPGTVFAVQGDFTGRFCVILEGLVSSYLAEGDGSSRLLWTLGAGQWFGEMCALSNRPEPATLRADARCVFVVIEQALFKQLFRGQSKFKELVEQTYRERSLSAHLRVAPIFKGLSEKQLNLLRKNAEILDYEKGALVAQTGAEIDALYLVRSGAIKVVTRDPQGRERLLAYHMDNSSFGEASLAGEKHAWRANYITMTPTTVLRLQSAVVKRVFVDDSKALTTIYRAAKMILESEEGSGGRIFDLDWQGAKEEGFSPEQLEIMVGKQSVKGGEALVINLSRCVRCNVCVESCVAVHDDRVPRLSKTGNRISTRFTLTSSCYNCDVPECMLACEFGAIRRDMQGLIRFVWDNCTGCQCCTTACPYGVISMTPPPPSADKPPRYERNWFLQTLPFIGHRFRGKHPAAEKASDAAAKPAGAPVVAALRGTKVSGKAVKCDLCAGLPFEACIYNCPTAAISRVSPERLFDEEGAVRL